MEWQIRFFRQNLLLWIAFISLTGILAAQDFPLLPVINSQTAKGDLYFLASRELQGREAGLPGGHTAGAFLASRLLGLGLEPITQRDSVELLENYYQYFQIVGMVPNQLAISFNVSGKNGTYQAELGKDFIYLFNSPAKVHYQGKAVFAGYDIFAPEYHYNDFAHRQCQGKILVAFYGEPLEKDTLVFFNGKHQTVHSLIIQKARTAAKAGARAVVLIPSPENRDKLTRFLKRWQGRLNQKQFTLKEEPGVPVILLTPEFAGKILGDWVEKNFQSNLTDLRKWLNQSDQKEFSWKGSHFPEFTWKLEIDYQKEDVRQCRNVLAVLPGRNPDLRNQYILIGSHYDHEGVREEGIYRGADDNASGDVANLSVARAYAHLKTEQRPERSILFAFWDAEEKGMLGSLYFTDHPLIPLKQIKTAINMDMVGRDASFSFMALRRPMQDEDAQNKVMLLYSAQVPRMEQLARQANDAVKLHLLFDPNVYFTSGSDHANFQPHHVPVVYYFTGFHTDYTSPGDTPDKIDYDKLARIARHIANFSYHLANLKEYPVFDTSILTAPEGDFRR